MKQKIFTVFVVGIISVSFLAGCNNAKKGNKSQENSSVESSQSTKVEYKKEKDGYTFDGWTYKYKYKVWDEDKESYYLILADSTDITYKNVTDAMLSSYMEPGKPKFVVRNGIKNEKRVSQKLENFFEEHLLFIFN